MRIFLFLILIAAVVIVILYNRDSNVVLKLPFFEKNVNVLLVIISSVIFGFLLSIPVMLKQRKKYKHKISEINKKPPVPPPVATIMLILLLPLLVFAGDENGDFKKCEKAYADKDYKTALESYDVFLKNYPKSKFTAEANFKIAELTEDYNDAVSRYRMLLTWYSGYDKIDLVHFRLAELYYLHNNYSESLAEYTRIIDKFQDSKYKTASVFWAGIIYLLKHKYNKAIENFYSAQLSDEYKIPATLGLANSFYEKEDYSSATNFFQKVLSFDSKNTAAYMGLANCYYAAGNYELALKFYKSILKEFPDSYESQAAESKVNFLKTHYTRESL